MAKRRAGAPKSEENGKFNVGNPLKRSPLSPEDWGATANPGCDDGMIMLRLCSTTVEVEELLFGRETEKDTPRSYEPNDGHRQLIASFCRHNHNESSSSIPSYSG